VQTGYHWRYRTGPEIDVADSPIHNATGNDVSAARTGISSDRRTVSPVKTLVHEGGDGPGMRRTVSFQSGIPNGELGWAGPPTSRGTATKAAWDSWVRRKAKT